MCFSLQFAADVLSRVEALTLGLRRDLRPILGMNVLIGADVTAHRTPAGGMS